jgi:glutathionyl-hydroquinone reductase
MTNIPTQRATSCSVANISTRFTIERTNPNQVRFSVPVLWDIKTNTIVNNESPEILRFLETAFDSLLSEEYKARNFYPEHLRHRIGEICDWMQSEFNSGVYKAGFAPNQDAYDKDVVPMSNALNRLEKLLAENNGPYILGQEMTEIDLRLYPTLIRFDTVYVQHFKCNLGTIRHDYPRLNNWMKNLYWNIPGFKETTDFKHIKENVSCWELCIGSVFTVSADNWFPAVYQKSFRYQPERHYSHGTDPRHRGAC